jgi:hypothetical protein
MWVHRGKFNTWTCTRACVSISHANSTRHRSKHSSLLFLGKCTAYLMGQLMSNWRNVQACECCHAEELLLIWVTPVWHAMWAKREKKDLSCLTESRATPTSLTLLQLLWVDANRDIPPSAPQRYIVTPGLSDNTVKNDQSIIILTCSFYCPGLYTIQDRKGSP